MRGIYFCFILFLFSRVVFAGQAILILDVEGVINTGTVQYVQRGVNLAKEIEAPLIVIKLNTPGGLLKSTRDIVQIIGASPSPVLVYVTPSGASATSAGTIITISAHYSAMAPGTNIGAAHPVGGQGEDISGDMKEKAINDTVAFIKAQAQLRKRNEDWAEKAIRKSISSTAEEALKLNVIDFMASDLSVLLSEVGLKIKKDLKNYPTQVLKPTATEQILKFLGDPNVSYLLMMAGGLGLYIELTTPGAVFPGVLGAICLILSFVSFSTLPVNYAGVALLVLGIVLFILEAFVTSFGLLTIGGTVSFVLGALFLMEPASGDLRLSLVLVIPTVLAFLSISLFIAYSIVRSRKNQYSGLVNFEGYIGEIILLNSDQVSGSCRIRGEIWDFKLDDVVSKISVGCRVKVTGQNGFRLHVKPIDE